MKNKISSIKNNIIEQSNPSLIKNAIIKEFSEIPTSVFALDVKNNPNNKNTKTVFCYDMYDCKTKYDACKIQKDNDTNNFYMNYYIETCSWLFTEIESMIAEFVNFGKKDVFIYSKNYCEYNINSFIKNTVFEKTTYVFDNNMANFILKNELDQPHIFIKNCFYEKGYNIEFLNNSGENKYIYTIQIEFRKILKQKR